MMRSYTSQQHLRRARKAASNGTLIEPGMLNSKKSRRARTSTITQPWRWRRVIASMGVTSAIGARTANCRAERAVGQALRVVESSPAPPHCTVTLVSCTHPQLQPADVDWCVCTQRRSVATSCEITLYGERRSHSFPRYSTRWLADRRFVRVRLRAWGVVLCSAGVVENVARALRCRVSRSSSLLRLFLLTNFVLSMGRVL